jgi:hypothetical protein
MSKTPKTDQSLPVITLSPEVQANPLLGIQQFFNGDSLKKVRNDLDNLRDTTITESYGDLDKEDKWLSIDLIRRLANLVEVAHLISIRPSIQ